MALGNKAWQVEQPARVRFIWRGEVETYFAGRAVVLVCHGEAMKVGRFEGAKVKCKRVPSRCWDWHLNCLLE